MGIGSASLVVQLIKNLQKKKKKERERICLQFSSSARRPRFDSWVRKIPWRRERLPTPVFLGFLVAQSVKNSPAMWETWVRPLAWEDTLEMGMATHSSILAWRISWIDEPARL